MTEYQDKPVRLKATERRRVRHADGELFDDDGESVVIDAYYRRLLDDGDLEIASGEKPASKKGSSK